MDNHWYFIINPKSGKGKALQLWEIVFPLLERSGISFSYGISEYHTHSIELVTSQYQKGTRHFIGLGGDGTINEIVNGIFRAQKFTLNDPCTLALFPIGTGNDWIKNHTALTTQNCIERIQNAQKSFHDIGTVQLPKTKSSHYFINVAGGGLDGFVTHEIGKLVQDKTRNSLSYLKGTLKALFQFSAPISTITIDNHIRFEGEMLLTAASIGKYFGSGMLISPKAKFDQGMLDITVVKKDSNWIILPHLGKLFNGKIGSAPFVEKYISKSVTVNSNKEIPIQADGENLGFHTSFTLSVLKHAIFVLQ